MGKESTKVHSFVNQCSVVPDLQLTQFDGHSADFASKLAEWPSN
jgi:hypothetical protein